MRRLVLGLIFALTTLAAYAQPFPSPTYNNITVGGNAAITGNLGVMGTANLIGGGTLTGTFTGTSIIRGVDLGFAQVTSSQLSGLSATRGDTVYVIDCQNGSESFPGSGCKASYNGTSWVLDPTPSNLSYTVAGLSAKLGGSIAGQGNGDKIQTATGPTPISGNCAQFNAGAAIVDSGIPCGGGGGGSGTVSPGVQFSMPFYSGAGTSSIIAAMGIVNNAVLVTNGSGQPSESQTLPSGLTIPTATMNNATMTGTTTIAQAVYTGKQTFAAPTVSSAGVNFPIGVAPSVPQSGDFWPTSTGLFWRNGSSTRGPYIASATASAPIVMSGVGTDTLTVTCPTCATISGGGALSATAPLNLSSGVLSLGGQTAPLTWIADSAFVVHNDTYPLIKQWPWTGNGTLNKIIFSTGGTTTPSFNVSFRICTGGVSGTCSNVTGCTNVSVSSTTDSTATCTALNTITSNQTLAMVISGVTGSPSSASVQLNLTKPAS